MKVKEIREMTVDELKGKAAELRKDLFSLKIQHRMGQVDKPSRLGAMKKDIARVLTVIAEKGRAGK
jgi:large subunit ribosomal protein L29